MHTEFTINKQKIEKWEGYNCYSSTIGSLLKANDYPYLSLVLNSNWDFFFDPVASETISMCGVFNATEHPAVADNLERTYGLKIHSASVAGWSECKELIRELLTQQAAVLLRVKNTSCRYIPNSGRSHCLAHYLICTGLHEDQFHFFDAFIGYSGWYNETAMSSAMKDVPDNGRFPGFSISWIHAIDNGKKLGHQPADIIGDNFFNALGTEAFGWGSDQVKTSDEGFLHLIDYLEQLSAQDLKITGRAFADSLRYVQYQRKCFAGSVEELASLLPAVFELNNTIADVRRLSDEWFGFRIRLLYRIERNDENIIQLTVRDLRRLFDEERSVHKRLELLKKECTVFFDATCQF